MVFSWFLNLQEQSGCRGGIRSIWRRTPLNVRRVSLKHAVAAHALVVSGANCAKASQRACAICQTRVRHAVEITTAGIAGSRLRARATRRVTLV